MAKNGLSVAEVRQRIEEYLEKRGIAYQKDVACRNRKEIHYIFKNKDGETVGVYLLLWNRPITYRTIFTLKEWVEKDGFEKIVLVCRIMGERAREVINKDPKTVSYILESRFRRGDFHPLMAAV